MRVIFKNGQKMGYDNNLFGFVTVVVVLIFGDAGFVFGIVIVWIGFDFYGMNQFQFWVTMDLRL